MGSRSCLIEELIAEDKIISQRYTLHKSKSMNDISQIYCYSIDSNIQLTKTIRLRCIKFYTDNINKLIRKIEETPF